MQLAVADVLVCFGIDEPWELPLGDMAARYTAEARQLIGAAQRPELAALIRAAFADLPARREQARHLAAAMLASAAQDDDGYRLLLASIVTSTVESSHLNGGVL